MILGPCLLSCIASASTLCTTCDTITVGGGGYRPCPRDGTCVRNCCHDCGDPNQGNSCCYGCSHTSGCDIAPCPPKDQSFDCEVTPSSRTCVGKPKGQGAFPTLKACKANVMCAPRDKTPYRCQVNATTIKCVKDDDGPFKGLSECSKYCAPPALG